MEWIILKRFDALKKIVEIVENELIICNIGVPSKELFYLRDRPENFYMLGSMGLASSIALGLAIAQPGRKVLSIDGDGSLLMNLGCLSTIANVNPKNLSLIVIDNGTYGSTGDQKTHTSNKTKLNIVAQGAGFDSINFIKNVDDITPSLVNLGEGCHFILIKTDPGNAKVDNIPLSPEAIKKRFRQSIEVNDS